MKRRTFLKSVFFTATTLLLPAVPGAASEFEGATTALHLATDLKSKPMVFSCWMRKKGIGWIFIEEHIKSDSNGNIRIEFNENKIEITQPCLVTTQKGVYES